MSEYMEELAQKRENMKRITSARSMWSMTPVDLEDSRKTKYRIRKYWQFCMDNNEMANPVGLCSFLGVSRKKMNEWKAGVFGSTIGEKLVQDALLQMENAWFNEFERNKNLPTYYIFIGKNWFGYKDTQDIQLTPNTPLGELQNKDELRKKIEQDIVIDVEPGEIKDAEY